MRATILNPQNEEKLPWNIKKLNIINKYLKWLEQVNISEIWKDVNEHQIDRLFLVVEQTKRILDRLLTLNYDEDDWYEDYSRLNNIDKL